MVRVLADVGSQQDTFAVAATRKVLESTDW